MFKELKDHIKKPKENIRLMSYQKKNINKDVEIIKQDQIDILELKSITKMKNLLEGINSRFQQTEEKLSTLEG